MASETYSQIRTWLDQIFKSNGRKFITGIHANEGFKKILLKIEELFNILGIASGIATLGEDGLLTSTQLPPVNATTTIPIAWQFDDAIALADPTSGFLNFNNADLSIATECRISKISELPFDASNILANAPGKDVLIIQNDDSAKFIFFTVDSIVDATSYYRLTISVLDSGALFTDAEILITSFFAGVALPSAGGHTIQDISDTSKDNEPILKYKGRVDSETGKTTIVPELETNNDFDTTGIQAGAAITRNATNDGFGATPVVPYTKVPDASIEPALTTTSDLISVIQIARSKIIGINYEERSAVGGTISIGYSSGTAEIVNAQTITASTKGELTMVIATGLANLSDNDLDLYVTITGSTALDLYFSTINDI